MNLSQPSVIIHLLRLYFIKFSDHSVLCSFPSTNYFPSTKSHLHNVEDKMSSIRHRHPDDQLMERHEALDTFDDSPNTDEDDSDYDSDGNDYFYPSSSFKKDTDNDETVKDQVFNKETDDNEPAIRDTTQEVNKLNVHEDEPVEIDYEALKKIAGACVPDKHGECISIVNVKKTASHQIDTLQFEDGWTCGCVSILRKLHANDLNVAFATMRLQGAIKRSGPEPYFVNLNSDHAIGAAFALMGEATAVDCGQVIATLEWERNGKSKT